MDTRSALKFPPQHKKEYVWFFDHYVEWQLFLRFRNIEIQGSYEGNPRRSVLMVANHVSWWDGFWGLYLNNKRLKKKYHVLMLEEQLAKRPFLNKAGAFSIAPGKQSVLASLNYIVHLLEEPGNMVLFFPQGRIYSQANRPVIFEKGIQYLLSRCSSNTDFLMVAWMTDYFSSPCPRLSLFYEKIPQKMEPRDIQDEYNRFLDDCIQKQDSEL